MSAGRAPGRSARSGAGWLHAVAGVSLSGVLLLAGCGAPAPGTTVHFDPTSVPFGLLGTEQTTSPDPDESDPSGPALWFVRRDKLVPTAADLDGGTPLDQAKAAVRQLQEGPSSQQHDAGLSNSLPPDIELDVRYVVSGVANVRYLATADSRPGANGPLLTGQIVLTLTSVPGVDAVIFDNGNRQVEAPLPGGALTDNPVTAEDYQELVAS